MAINAWKKAVWPGAGADKQMKEPSRAGNPVTKKGDKHGMERVTPKSGKPGKSGTQVDWPS
jgi:hypothetical protein